MVQVVQPSVRRPRFADFCLPRFDRAGRRGLRLLALQHDQFRRIDASTATRGSCNGRECRNAGCTNLSDGPRHRAGLRTRSRSTPRSTASCNRSTSSKARWCSRATCWRRSIRASIRPRWIRRRPRKRRTKRNSSAPRRISSASDPGCEAPPRRSRISTSQIAWWPSSRRTIEADQAAIESAQTQLDYTTITAPTDGRMGIRQVDPGNIMHANDTTTDRGAHPDQADRGHLHPAGKKSRRRAERDGARPGAGPRLRPGRQAAARDRHADADRQSDRSDHQHDQAEGHFSERRRSPVAGRVRACASADRYAQRARSPFHPRRCSAGRRACTPGASPPDGTAQPQSVEPPHRKATSRSSTSGVAAGDRVVVERPIPAAGGAHAGRGQTAREPPGEARREHLRTLHSPADRHLAADGGVRRSSAWWRFRFCRSRRCRKSTSRPSRCRRTCRRQPRHHGVRPSPPRSSGNSARSPASRR